MSLNGVGLGRVREEDKGRGGEKKGEERGGKGRRGGEGNGGGD